MEPLAPFAALEQALREKPKPRARARKGAKKATGNQSPEHLARMTEAATEANRRNAEQRRQEEEAIRRAPPKSSQELHGEALTELALQLKHRDPRVRKEAMKEVFKLNREKGSEDDPTEVVYITPAMRDDVDDIEEMLQTALAEQVIDAAEHVEEPRKVPAFVPASA